MQVDFFRSHTITVLKMPAKETARQHRALAQDQYKRGQYMEAMQSADKARCSSLKS
jgi:hypothetical protein